MARQSHLMAIALLCGPLTSVNAAPAPHEPVEWTWAEFPDRIDQALPDVLLEGDSITRNYYPEVRRLLAGKANVFLFATSACVGDPRLETELRAYRRLAGRSFKVVHFNNGMHGWKISDADYEKFFPRYLRAIHDVAPFAKRIWTSTTNMRVAVHDDASNERIADRNRRARDAIQSSAISTDDQNLLMAGRTSLYEDDIHFGTAGSAIQAVQVAQTISQALP
ncbi:MAG: SGNH/GDSL hydrolase family protein [Sphingomonas sp.]|nr:SGNH/GDSL hydrolase family protein [Sphingomonas sp.]